MINYRFLRFPGGKAKAVTFSYDDGSLSDIKLCEIMNRYGIKGTFNLCGSFIGEGESNRSFMSAAEIKEHILASGHEIAVHGEYHRAPGKQRPIEIITDMLNCRLHLEDLFGGIIRGCAYPDSGITSYANGTDYESVKRVLEEIGIVYSRSLAGDNDRFELPQDWYNWIPTAHHSNPEVMNYIEKFNNLEIDPYSPRRTPKLFYLWGHSFEYQNNGWELCENICKALSGNDEVWYATNIQIRDYVDAYMRLVYSADGNTVYNPTLFDIWFEQSYNDGTHKIISVKSGETVSVK